MSAQASRRRGFDDLPQHAPVLTAAKHQPVALQDGEVLRDVRPADLEQLGELARRAWRRHRGDA